MTRPPVRVAIRTTLVCTLSVWGGCSRDVRLSGHNIRKNVTVRAVTHYGMTLDEQADPEQVAHAVLRAIRDDFLAADSEQRETALDTQFDLCAADVIARHNRTGRSRDEFIYDVVYHWTPTVSHYVHDFETDWDAAKRRFARRGPRPGKGANAGAMECEVLMEVADPGGDPNARAVMVVYLARDQGFWRVVHLGFDRATRSIARAQASDEGS